MPCLESKDLTNLINQHVDAQKGIVTQLRQRLTDIEKNERIAASNGDLTRSAILKAARIDLEFHLNGKKEDPLGSGKFVEIPGQKTAEERVAIMEAQYRQSPQFEFHDTTKNSAKPRTASVFGLPTAKQMRDLGHNDIADEIDTRALSLSQLSQASKNPEHYIENEGLDVKTALSNGIEHHHIFNNVYLSPQGRVQFKSFKVFLNKKTNKPELSVIPSYWNAEEHGRNTQFIGLLDGMHSGADPATHLHYYEFTDTEKKEIISKIQADHPTNIAAASARIPKLQEELKRLQKRRINPTDYESSLNRKIKTAETARDAKQKEMDALPKIIDKYYPTDDSKEIARTEKAKLRNEVTSLRKNTEKLINELSEHRTIQSLKSDIAKNQTEQADFESKAAAIGKLTTYPKGVVRDAKRTEREQHENEVLRLKTEINKQNQLLKSKSDLDGLVAEVKQKIKENSAIAKMSVDDTIKLFEETNGFFRFDKGHEEKDLHTQYRPVMNEEITRYQAREALAHLKKEYGNNALDAINAKIRQQYKRNLLLRLQALSNKFSAI
jgi:hypothetical protein